MSGTAMYMVTNKSSRTFVFGKLMLLPKTPTPITSADMEVIKHSAYAANFEFQVTNQPPANMPETP
jgi:hypothetical protein